jgi:hypothetical protein
MGAIKNFKPRFELSLTNVSYGQYEQPRAIDVTDWLTQWTDERINTMGMIQANIPGYKWWYIGYNSYPRHNWDFKPQLKSIPNYRNRKYKFGENYYRFDEIGNIGWGRIMGSYGIDPLAATFGAGVFQWLEVNLLGQNKPSNPPFGDDIRDFNAILRGYMWAYKGRY